jgi:hypothetical protein
VNGRGGRFEVVNGADEMLSVRLFNVGVGITGFLAMRTCGNNITR